MSENKFLRTLLQSYKKIIKETEIILSSLDTGKDLLMRLKNVQKSESKSYNLKEIDPDSQ